MAKMTFYNSIPGVTKALRQVPKAAQARLRDASQRIAGGVAEKAESKAQSVGGALKLVSVKGSRDRVPVVKMTAPKVKPVTFGAEFGGGARPTTRQFMPHLGRVGYALWPTVRAMSKDIREEYSGALLDALEESR